MLGYVQYVLLVFIDINAYEISCFFFKFLFKWDALIQEHINQTNLKDPEEIEQLYYYKRTVYPGLVAGVSKLLKER